MCVSDFLPRVTPKETADEDKFACPQPWYLVLVAMAMSCITTMTVAGSLFFVLAAPERVSPHCHEFEWQTTRAMCTFSVVCAWTYPVVCCLFVVLVFAKNLVDQRVYYEFLLHKVVIVFDRSNPLAYSVVIILLVYALSAFSALIWLHIAKPEEMLNSAFGSLAYISPIMYFLAVIFTQWSIQGKLITLPNFLVDYTWGVQHLSDSHSYHIESIHLGYRRVEGALDKTSVSELTTPHIIALVEYYTKELEAEAVAESNVQDESRQQEARPADVEVADDRKKEQQHLAGVVVKKFANVGKGVGEGIGTAINNVDTKMIYWQWRLLFNPRLQDDRAQNFRHWALGYFVSVILAIVLGIYVYTCVLITCLEIEKVLMPGTQTWSWTHTFSLRPDLDHGEIAIKSFKQFGVKAAANVMQDGARVFKTGASAFSHFQLGAAA